MNIEALTRLRDTMKADQKPDADLLREAFGNTPIGDTDTTPYVLALWAINGLPSGRPSQLTHGRGSVDAALALYEAVMPSTRQYSIETDPTCLKVHIAAWPDGLSARMEIQGEGWHIASEGSAFVWALADALIAWDASSAETRPSL